MPSSPARVLGDHPTLGACFIDPYQNVPTNAKTQRGGTCHWLAGKRRLSKAETCPSSSHRSSFRSAPSRTSLQSTSTLPFTAHMCEPPSNPTLNLSPAAPFAPTIGPAQSLLTARESHVLHLLLLAQGWQSTPMVSILNKRSCCWVLQLRPRSDFGRLVLARSKPLGGARALSDRA